MVMRAVQEHLKRGQYRTSPDLACWSLDPRASSALRCAMQCLVSVGESQVVVESSGSPPAAVPEVAPLPRDARDCARGLRGYESRAREAAVRAVQAAAGRTRRFDSPF